MSNTTLTVKQNPILPLQDSFFQEDDDFAPEGYSWLIYNWDRQKLPQKMILSPENPMMVTMKKCNGFRTVMGDYAMQQGCRYYYEIKIIEGSLMKIGVCRSDTLTDRAFCDTDAGWGIYNGQLKHGEQHIGKYADGKSKVNSGDVIGVMLDMVNGTLSFKKNGVYLGIAFQSEELKRGLLYPAVAPVQENDCFSIRQPLPED